MKRLTSYPWHEFGRGFRGTVLILLSLLLLLVALSIAVRGQSRSAQSSLETEHRLTAVETQIFDMRKDIGEIKRGFADLTQHTWLVLIGLAGLLGERGVQLFRGGGKGES